MSDIEELLNDLGLSDDLASEELPTEEVVEEAEVDTPAVLDDTILDDLIETEKETEPLPEPVKPRRGRPKGSTNKKKVETAKEEPKVEPVKEEPKVETKEEVVEEVPVNVPEEETVEEVKTETADENVEEQVKPVRVATTSTEARDFYILSECQIINGHPYRRGQKITFTKGDKFYESQTDRNGNNWLDLIDDYEAQYAHFGRVMVEPDRWSGIPFGSTEGIDHPALALAISNFAKSEIERNGQPFN